MDSGGVSVGFFLGDAGREQEAQCVELPVQTLVGLR